MSDLDRRVSKDFDNMRADSSVIAAISESEAASPVFETQPCPSIEQKSESRPQVFSTVNEGPSQAPGDQLDQDNGVQSLASSCDCTENQGYNSQKRAYPGGKERKSLKAALDQQRCRVWSLFLFMIVVIRARAERCWVTSRCVFGRRLDTLRRAFGRFVSSLQHALDSAQSMIDLFVRSLRIFFHRMVDVGVPVVLVFLVAALVLAAWQYPRVFGANTAGDNSPSQNMFEHSMHALHRSKGTNNASVALLKDHLQLKHMEIDMDTQVFTATRITAGDIIKSTCVLPEKICNAMAKAGQSREIKYHKKSSVPLNANEGSYYEVWMWVRATGRADEVQVAFKAASLSYQLRDVVTYKDNVEEEPVIKCEISHASYWFSSSSTENCRHVSTKRTVTQVPVFTQAVMSPQEMDFVHTLMEETLAKKSLDVSR